MAWGLIAAAAAGMNAGSGLHCLLIESQPDPAADPVLAEAVWQVARTRAPSKVALSSALSSLAAAASLAAYTNAGDAADPAHLTCALASASVPLWNFLVLSPTASVVSNKAMDAAPPRDRQSWLSSFQRKSAVAVAAAALAFACTLLVVGADTGEAGAGGTVNSPKTANPLRF